MPKSKKDGRWLRWHKKGGKKITPAKRRAKLLAAKQEWNKKHRAARKAARNGVVHVNGKVNHVAGRALKLLKKSDAIMRKLAKLLSA